MTQIKWQVVVTVLLAVGCKSRGDELRDEDLKLKPQDWQEFSSGDLSPLDIPPPPMPAHAAHGARGWPASAAEVQAGLVMPSPFAGGTLGMQGTSRVFVVAKSKAATEPRLQWIQVKLLSERYGCFLRARLELIENTWTWCKDGRQIIFWNRRSHDYLAFKSRQFDAQGHEIEVRRRQMVRLGSSQLL